MSFNNKNNISFFVLSAEFIYAIMNIVIAQRIVLKNVITFVIYTFFILVKFET